MTFTSRDVKDVADLVARKLELYMNLERRENRFKPEGCYRTTPKMEEYDLLFRVDDSLAKGDTARALLAGGGRGPRGPKAKKSKSSASSKKKANQKTSKVKDTEKCTQKEAEGEGQDSEVAHVESERGKYEENSKSDDGAPDVDTRSHDAAVHDQEIVDEEAHTNRKDNPETDKKSNTQSGKSKPKAKDTQKENRLSSKQKRKKKDDKPVINPKLTDPSLHVVPVREVNRLTSFANSLFNEQPIEKLHVIHRYRPNSADIPHLTENGKVQNYTDHVGAALHSVKYIDYYLKEGLQTGKKEFSKRLQELKPAKAKPEERPSNTRVVMSDGGKPHRNTSQRKKTTRLTADPMALVRRGSTSSTSSYRYSSSSFHSDFTTSYIYNESSSSAFSLTASQTSLLPSRSSNPSLPTIKTAWMSTPRRSKDLIPTPYSSRDNVPGGENLSDNRPLYSDEDSVSLSSFDSKLSKYMSYAQKYYDTTTTDLVSRSETETTKKDMFIRPTTQETKQNNTVMKKKTEANLKCTSNECEKHAKSDCDEICDGTVDSTCSSENRGDNEEIYPPNPDIWRGYQKEGTKYQKEESRGSVTEELMDATFSLESKKANYYRSSYAYVPEERGNEQEVSVFIEGDPFYITADQMWTEREKEKTIESIDKTSSSSRGVLPKLSNPCWKGGELQAGVLDQLGEENITATSSFLHSTRVESSHGRGISNSDQAEVQSERSLSRLSRGSFDRDKSLDQIFKDDFSLPADVSVNVILDSLETSDPVQLVSRRASVEKCIPDDLPFEAQYTPEKPFVQKDDEKRCDSSLSRASIGPVPECERNGLSLSDEARVKDQIEMEENELPCEGNRGILPEPTSDQNESSKNDKGDLKSTTITDYVPVLILEPKSDSQRSTELSIQKHQDSEIQSHPENYVPSPRSRNISTGEQEVAADLKRNLKKKREKKTSAYLIKGLAPADTAITDTRKTPVELVDSVSNTKPDQSVDSKSESHADVLKDSILKGNTESRDISKKERRHSSASMMSLNSLDITDLKPGNIPSPSRKILKENIVITKTEKENGLSSSVTSFASSRGADSEKLSDISGISVNSQYASSKTPSRGSDSASVSSTSSTLSRKKLVPLNTGLLSSSGQTLTRGVESRMQRTSKISTSSKLSTQSSTDDDTNIQQTSLKVSGEDTVDAQDSSLIRAETKSISLILTSGMVPEVTNKDDVAAHQAATKTVAADGIENIVASTYLEAIQAISKTSESQKEDSDSDTSSVSTVSNNVVFSSTSTETSDKDDSETTDKETEPGSMVATRWSTTSKDDLGTSSSVSTSLTSSTQSFSDHTDVSSRGTDNEVQGLVIDINKIQPLPEVSLEQKLILKTQNVEGNESCMEFNTAVNVPNENHPDTDLNKRDNKIDFVLSLPNKTSPRSMSTEQVQESHFTVDMHERIPIVVCSRGSDRGDISDSESQLEEVALHLQALHQKLAETVSPRELSPRIESRSSSNLSQASLTKVNLQQKETETADVPCIREEYEKQISPPTISLHSTVDFFTKDIVTDKSLDSSKSENREYADPVVESCNLQDEHHAEEVFDDLMEQDAEEVFEDLKEQDAEPTVFDTNDHRPEGLITDVLEEDPWGLILDLQEHDNERGDFISDEDADHENVIFPEQIKEIQTKVEEKDDGQVTELVVVEDNLHELEARGELHVSDNGRADIGENINILEERIDALKHELISDQIDAIKTRTTDVENILKEEDVHPSVAEILDLNKESQCKETYSVSGNIQTVNVSEVKPLGQLSSSSSDERNGEAIVESEKFSLINGSRQTNDESETSVRGNENNTVSPVQRMHSDQGSNEILLINLYIDDENIHETLSVQENGNEQNASTLETTVTEKSVPCAPQHTVSEMIYDATFITAIPIESLDHIENVNNIISQSLETEPDVAAIPDSLPKDGSSSVKMSPLQMKKDLQKCVYSSPQFQASQNEIPQEGMAPVEMNKQDTSTSSPHARNNMKAPSVQTLAMTEPCLEVMVYQQFQIQEDTCTSQPPSEISQQEMKPAQAEQSSPSAEESHQRKVKRDSSSQYHVEPDTASTEVEQSLQDRIMQGIAPLSQSDKPSYDPTEIHSTPLQQTTMSSENKLEQDITPQIAKSSHDQDDLDQNDIPTKMEQDIKCTMEDPPAALL